MNNAYNQMPLDEQSRRLTQYVIGNQKYEFNRLFYGISIGPATFSAFMNVIGNQKYEFNRLFYGISIGPATFSAFMSEIFRPLILSKITIRYLDNVFMPSQTKDEMFTVLGKYHQILKKKNTKAAPDKSHFFLTRVKFLGHIIKKDTVAPMKSRIEATQKH